MYVDLQHKLWNKAIFEGIDDYNFDFRLYLISQGRICNRKILATFELMETKQDRLFFQN